MIKITKTQLCVQNVTIPNSRQSIPHITQTILGCQSLVFSLIFCPLVTNDKLSWLFLLLSVSCTLCITCRTVPYHRLAKPISRYADGRSQNMNPNSCCHLCNISWPQQLKPETRSTAAGFATMQITCTCHVLKWNSQTPQTISFTLHCSNYSRDNSRTDRHSKVLTGFNDFTKASSVPGTTGMSKHRPKMSYNAHYLD